MERFIADLVQDFESGKINRRQFCETVALAATVYAAGEEAANAAPSQGFKMIAVNRRSAPAVAATISSRGTPTRMRIRRRQNRSSITFVIRFPIGTMRA